MKQHYPTWVDNELVGMNYCSDSSDRFEEIAVSEDYPAICPRCQESIRLFQVTVIIPDKLYPKLCKKWNEIWEELKSSQE